MNKKRGPRPVASGGKTAAPKRFPLAGRTAAFSFRILVLVVLLAVFRWRFDSTPMSSPSPTPATAQASPNEGTGDESDHRSKPPAQRQLAVSGDLPVATSRDWKQLDNPEADGWTIEVVSERAKETLVQLGPWLAGDPKVNESDLLQLLAPSFTTDGFRPETLKTVALADEYRVERWSTEHNASSPAPDTFRWKGTAGWQSAIAHFHAPWSGAAQRRIEFKIFRALRDEQGLVTQQYVALSGNTSSGAMEQHATWEARWESDPKSKTLRLRSVDVLDFEQVTSPQSERWLVEATPAILGGETSYREQLLRGLSHWIDRNQDLRYFSPLGNPGLAVGDVNGDGREDLYVCQEANLPNRLYIQQADGSAVDQSATWQVDFLEGSRCALLVDFDNDGDQDLAVAILGGVILASNEGQSFVIRAVLETNDDTTSLAASDYDLDGDVDLYVCVDYPNDYFASRRSVPAQGGAANRVYHDANNGGRNALFRNDVHHPSQAAAWSFANVTSEVGLDRDEQNQRYSWAAGWEDFDNDGDQDLYVSNDFGRNNLFINQDGQFSDQAAKAGAEDIASGMSAAWGDPNRDGHMDLYVGNMFSSAGGRITFQPEFKSNADPLIRQRLQRFARGNTLLLNQGDSTFHDASEEAHVTVGRWAWSSNFFDINNDGWQDIAVANGYLTAEDTGDL